MSSIKRLGSSPRWADVVIHQGTAYWVEVAENAACDTRGQIEQVLSQTDATLQTIGSDRTRLLQVLVYLRELSDMSILNELWDAWVPTGHAPVRACVGAELGGTYRVELVVTAAC